MVADGFAHPTSFEVETVLGFLYYKEKNCDMVVLETGMGGRLDATNVIPDPQKLLAVFASVSMDHMAYRKRKSRDHYTGLQCGNDGTA